MNFFFINDLDISKRMLNMLSRAKYATSYVVFRKSLYNDMGHKW